MGGIAGFFDVTRDSASPDRGGAAQRMGEALPGPGGTPGLWACPQGALILRGEDGAEEQLLERPLGTARYAIAWSGRLSNGPAVRKFLRAQGFRLTSPGDAEAALYAYMEYGRAVSRRLEGDFAFALWDGLKRRFLACRSAGGRQPLFYSHLRDTLAFASHEGALTACPGLPSRPEIRVLEPGEWLTLDPTGIRTGQGSALPSFLDAGAPDCGGV